MSRITADQLREVIVAMMIENAQVRAASGPVIMPAHLDLEELPLRFDEALQEFNDVRRGAGLREVEIDAAFKQAVIDSMVKRFEAVGRVMMGC